MNQRLSILVVDFADGPMKPLSRTIATIAAGKDDHSCAKKGEDSFFHNYKLLIFKCFSFVEI